MIPTTLSAAVTCCHSCELPSAMAVITLGFLLCFGWELFQLSARAAHGVAVWIMAEGKARRLEEAKAAAAAKKCARGGGAGSKKKNKS